MCLINQVFELSCLCLSSWLRFNVSLLLHTFATRRRQGSIFGSCWWRLKNATQCQAVQFCVAHACDLWNLSKKKKIVSGLYVQNRLKKMLLLRRAAQTVVRTNYHRSFSASQTHLSDRKVRSFANVSLSNMPIQHRNTSAVLFCVSLSVHKWVHQCVFVFRRVWCWEFSRRMERRAAFIWLKQPHVLTQRCLANFLNSWECESLLASVSLLRVSNKIWYLGVLLNLMQSKCNGTSLLLQCFGEALLQLCAHFEGWQGQLSFTLIY